MRNGIAVILAISVSLTPLSASAQAPPPAKPRPQRRIAILPLRNLRPTKEANWIGEGASETITTKLATIPHLRMVERSRLGDILDEQDLQISGLTDPRTAVKVGKLLGAERILCGTYVQVKKEILFNVRVIDVKTGLVLNTAAVRAKQNSLFDAFFGLADAVIRSFDKKAVIVNNRPVVTDAPQSERIELTPSQRKRLRQLGTNNYDARVAWLKGHKAKTADAQIHWYTKAIDLDGQFGWAYMSRGIAYNKKHDYEAAIRDYNKAIDIAPQSAGAYCGRGQAYSSKGDHDRAIRDYNKAIELDPSDSALYSTRAVSFFLLESHEKAVADYMLAKKLAGRNDKAQKALRTKLPKIDFKGVPLELAVNFFREVSNPSIYVNWRALKTKGIGRESEVRAHLTNTTVADALRHLLQSLPGLRPNADYIVLDGIIIISSPSDLAALTRLHTLQHVQEWQNILADAPDDSALRQRLPKVDFAAVPLELTLQFFREVSGLDIVVDWASLRKAGVLKTTESNVHLVNVTFRKVLRLILIDACGGDAISYTVKGKRIAISRTVDIQASGRRNPSQRSASSTWDSRDPLKVQLSLAQTYVASGMNDKARRLLAQAIQDYPKSPHVAEARKLLRESSGEMRQ